MKLLPVLFTRFIPFLMLLIASVQQVNGQPVADNSNSMQLTAGDYEREFDVNGFSRKCYIHVPASYSVSRAAAVVLIFHGGGGTAFGTIRLTGMNQSSDRNGFIAVYPESVNRHWNDGAILPGKPEYDDVTFVGRLIDYLAGKLNIDRSRVFATGISNGGFFSERLALELSNKIAAVAMVAATMRTEQVSMGPPTRVVPAMFILGTADPIVSFNGGTVGGRLFGDRGQALSATSAVDYWIRFDRCPAIPKVETLPGSNPSDGTSVRRFTYGPGKNNSEVIFYEVSGGGHCWPDGLQYLPVKLIGKTSRALNADEAIWQFFARHGMR